MELTQSAEQSAYYLLSQCPDPAMQEVVGLIGQFADVRRVILTGESGSGKDLVARALHEKSARQSDPFVVFDAAAQTKELVASTLFGHEKGAFTGAMSRRIGRIEQAGEGTLFIDEIGELPIDLQPKLLRVLDGKSFNRVGGNEEIRSSCKVVVATNRNLHDMVDQGTFRTDLFYRLKACEIYVPPLRSRRMDIVYLAGHFAGQYNKRFTPEALELFAERSWSGNVRELGYAVEHSAIRAGAADQILPHHLPDNAPLKRESKVEVTIEDIAGFFEGQPLEEAVDLVERALVERALSLTDGDLDETAKALSVSAEQLDTMLRKWEIG